MSGMMGDMMSEDGVACPTPAELRAEVERWKTAAHEFETAYVTYREWFEAADAAADRRMDQSIAWTERAESAEAERDALQQRLDNVQALAEDAMTSGERWVPTDLLVRAALGGPAAPPQELQPTPEACWDCGGRGMVPDPRRPEEPLPCERCYGSGSADACHRCAAVSRRPCDECRAHAARQPEPVERMPMIPGPKRASAGACDG